MRMQTSETVLTSRCPIQFLHVNLLCLELTDSVFCRQVCINWRCIEEKGYGPGGQVRKLQNWRLGATDR